MNNENRKSRIATKLSAALITTTALTMAVSAAGYTNYVVKSGDNLTSIARAHNTTVSAIVAANNLANPDLIYASQHLAIPTGAHHGHLAPVAPYAPVAPVAPVTPSVSTSVDTLSYTVQYGDTLNSIAGKYGTTAKKLAEMNGIANINVIETGKVLKIGEVVSYTQLGDTSYVASTQYTVQSGDTLNEIARRFGTSARYLAAVNNISNVNVIHVGDVLTVAPNGYYYSNGVRAFSGSDEELLATVPESAEMEALYDMVAVEVEAVATVDTFEIAIASEEFVETLAVEIPAEEVTVFEFLEEIEEEAGFEIEPEPEVELPTEVVKEIAPVVEETLSAVEPEPVVAMNQYCVQETASVFHLAALFNTTVADLLQWNDIADTNSIPAGTVLQVSV